MLFRSFPRGKLRDVGDVLPDGREVRAHVRVVMPALGYQSRDWARAVRRERQALLLDAHGHDDL